MQCSEKKKQKTRELHFGNSILNVKLHVTRISKRLKITTCFEALPGKASSQKTKKHASMQGWTGEYWEYAQWGDTLLGQFFFLCQYNYTGYRQTLRAAGHQPYNH